MYTLKFLKRAARLMLWAAVLSMLAFGANLSAAHAAPSSPEKSSMANTVVTCPGFLPSRLAAGQHGRVTPGLPNRVRFAPGSAVIGYIPGGGTFRVLAGPQCGINSAWWLVDFNGLVGWTSEGTGYTYYLEPIGPIGITCPGFLPSRLAVGGWGRVTPGTPNRLRTVPDGPTLALIPGGAAFSVIGGPVCGWRTAWWKVNYNGIVGWTREGASSVYWLEPLY
jgi:hypothetical protein